MKKLLLIALILITNFISAQTFTKYVDDAQKNGIGFNYNVTFQLTLKRMATKSTVSSAANGTEYSVRLVSVEVDQNSGWNQRGKTYSCSQLNGICNNKTFDRITIDLDYDCEGKELSSNSATFYNIGDEKIMTLQPKAVGSNVCASPTVSDIGKVTITEVSVTNTILSIIQKLDQNKSNTSTQNTNTGNQSNTNNSIGQIPDDYTGNPLHYNNPNVSSGSSAVDKMAKSYAQGQQIAEIATGLVDLFAPTPAQLQRRAAEAAEYERLKKIKHDIKEKEKEERFLKLYYYPYIDKAKKGDDNARMILYYASYDLWCTEFVPQREEWFNSAYKNKNLDAILDVSNKSEDRLSMLENAANLGSADAMVMLGDWFDRRNTTAQVGGDNSKTSLYWFEKAAKKNNPKALYFLGMIYKYGITPDLSNGYGFLKRTHVKYDIGKDEKIAFEYFSKALENENNISLFARGADDYGFSRFDSHTLKELAIFYKNGMVVEKDKKKAKELEIKYKNYEFVEF